MTAEAKMKLLAQQDPVLAAFFFSGGQQRWFDGQLQPGYLKILTPTQIAGGMSATCARVKNLSTAFMYTHETATRQACNELERPRFQIDVLDYDPERAAAARAAIKNWLSTVDFSSNVQFASPPTSPRKHPNFVLNQWSGPIEATPQPPVHMRCLEIRITNLEE